MLKKIRNRVNIFRIKLFLGYVILFSVLCILMAYSFFRDFQAELKQYTTEEIQHNLLENVAAVEAKLDAVSDAGMMLKFALEQNSAVMTPKTDNREVDIYSRVQNTFSTYTSLLDETYNVSGFSYFYLYFPYRTLLLVSDATFFQDVLSNTLDCFQIEQEKWGLSESYNNVICNPVLGQYFNDYDLVRNYQFQDKEGNELFLTACIDERYINRLLSANFQIQPTWMVILDSYGKIISTEEQQDLKEIKAPYVDIINKISDMETEDSIEITLDQKKYILNWTYSAENNWYYVCATDLETILSGSVFWKSINLVVCVCLILMAAVLAYITDKYMNSQAKDLICALQDIEQQMLSETAPILSKASVRPDKKYCISRYGEVYQNFYEMTVRVCEVAKEALKKKNKLTLTTIQMLQTELDPHMLYNSLESAYSIAKINKQEEIADLIMALSKFFRIALSGGKSFVEFREAFELSKQYIIVQNIRVNNKITFEYEIDERIHELLVPKFLLQPLVENAVIHGFKNKSDNWNITITAEKRGNIAEILVSDNGIGMSELELEKLNIEIKMPIFEENVEKRNKGYALRNLNYQIHLRYGEASGVTVYSTYGEGTKVKIILCQEKEK